MSHKNSRSSLARNDEFDHSSSSAVTGKRNRSQSSSSSARQEHLRKSDRGENAIEVDEDGVRPKLFVADKDDLASIVTGTFAITGAQQAKWTNMPMDAQALCVKAIVRMLVMKGARNEIVSRAQIIDSLAVIDPNYKKHVDVVLSESQKVLVEVFGYTLTSGDEVREADGKKESLYVSNAVKSPALLATLSELADDDAAFTGFAFVIFQILFTSPAKTADSKSILQKLRKIDNRFPETLLGRGKGNSVAKRANPVPELKEDFLGLMDQMKRRGYLIATKDEKEPEDPGKVVYTLGTRFAVDLGKKRLMRAYFATLGQDMDKNLLKEFREQDLAEEDRRKPEEDEADDE